MSNDDEPTDPRKPDWSRFRPATARGTMTLEEHRKWAETATRNYTDSAIGRDSAGKRNLDATRSEIVTASPPVGRQEPRHALRRWPVADQPENAQEAM